MILYGANGHGKVILNICEKNKVNITSIIDDNADVKTLMNYQVIPFKELISNNDKFIISIGNNEIRKKVVKRIEGSFGLAIHPNTIIDASVVIKEGTVIMAGAIINSSTSIGKHCIINTSSSVDHDCVIDDFVHISPNATLSGGVKVGEGTHIGAGAVIIPNISIGKWCNIGAGAVIIENIPLFPLFSLG